MAMTLHRRMAGLANIASRDRTSGQLSSVHVQELQPTDGNPATARLEVCDGKRLLVVDHIGLPLDEMPVISGSTPGAFHEAILPALELKKFITSNKPKGKYGQVSNDYVTLSSDGEPFDPPSGTSKTPRTIVSWTDCEVAANKTLCNIEANYPDIQAVMPKGEPVLTIRVNPLLLAELLTTINSVLANKEKPVAVTMRLYGPLDAIRLDAERDGDKVKAVIMPLTK